MSTFCLGDMRTIKQNVDIRIQHHAKPIYSMLLNTGKYTCLHIGQNLRYLIGEHID